MEERDFYNESPEQKTAKLQCPHCRTDGDYRITWIVRRRKPAPPPRADAHDRARFAKMQNYMVRRDDKVSCQNPRCRKPFDVTGLQSVVFL